MSSGDLFRIRDHVADFDDLVTDIIKRSEATRAVTPMVADIAYGSGPAETLDLFLPLGPAAALPVHLFIHGGYWRAFSKRDYSYIADTITRAGGIAVIIDYALMPSVRMGVIVDQVRRAKHWVIQNIAKYGGDPNRLTVSGHSAGAHLATFLFNQPQLTSGIDAALLLGGLYDLKPLQSSFLKDEIGITDEEVTDFTPLGHKHDVRTRVDVIVGADETEPFHQTSEQFAHFLRRQGSAVSEFKLPERNHMNSVRDLGVENSAAGRRLRTLIQLPTTQ